MTTTQSKTDHNDLLEIIGEIKDSLKPHDHYMNKILARAEYILGVRTEEQKEEENEAFRVSSQIYDLRGED